MVQNTSPCLGAAHKVWVILPCKFYHDFLNLRDAVTEEFSGAAGSAVFLEVKLRDSIHSKKAGFIYIKNKLGK